MSTNQQLLTQYAATLPAPDARESQLVALFRLLDERGQLTTLALLATAAKLHPRSA